MKKIVIALLIVLMFVPAILFTKEVDVVSAKTIAELREELRKIEEREKEIPSEIISELEKVDVNVLTPIEALNILNKLKSLI